MSRFLSFQNVSFTYDSLGEFLLAGLVAPQNGRIHRPGAVAYCPQRTDEPAEKLGEFLSADGLARC